MKQIYLFILTALFACQSTNAQAQDGNTDYYEEPKFLNLTQEEQACANACNDFTFRLFRASKEEENIVLSPLSVTYALSMLNNGASGETREEIKRALGFGDKEVADINAFCNISVIVKDFNLIGFSCTIIHYQGLVFCNPFNYIDILGFGLAGCQIVNRDLIRARR